MKIYPAIDILHGQAVRLRQGRKPKMSPSTGTARNGATLGRRRARNGCMSSTSTAPLKESREIIIGGRNRASVSKD